MELEQARKELITLQEQMSAYNHAMGLMSYDGETTVKLDVKGTSLTAVVFGDVDYPVDAKVRIAFHKAAVIFDKETGKNLARGKLMLV